MLRNRSVAAALAVLDTTEAEDRGALAEAQGQVAFDVDAGRFPTSSALESLAVFAPTVDLWATVNRMHRLRVLDADAEPDLAPSRLDVLRDEAGRVLDAAVRFVRLDGSASPAGRLAEQGEQVAELSWARQVLDAVSGLPDRRNDDG
jgi:hypothetical protein